MKLEYKFMKEPAQGKRFKLKDHIVLGNAIMMYFEHDMEPDTSLNDVFLSLNDMADATGKNALYVDNVNKDCLTMKSMGWEIEDLRRFTNGEEFVKVASVEFIDEEE